MLTDKCILQYDPKPLSGNAESLFKPWWAISVLQDGNDLQEYYKWFVQKQTGLKLMRPAWGPHISIIRGEEPLNKELWKKYEGQQIDFFYDEFIKTNGGHWWIKIYCDQMNDLREELGLQRRHAVGLHLTIGTPVPYQAEHSFYYSRFLQQITP